METAQENQNITISKIMYLQLKKKAEIADDAIVQLKLSMEDLKRGKVSRFN